MTSLIVWLFISILALWLLVMLALWVREKEPHEDVLAEIKPIVGKGKRTLRKTWFLMLRKINKLREIMTSLIAKLFFKIFPKAKQAFEKKDIESIQSQGPSSEFLASISENMPAKEKKSGRKRKNV